MDSGGSGSLTLLGILGSPMSALSASPMTMNALLFASSTDRVFLFHSHSSVTAATHTNSESDRDLYETQLGLTQPTSE